MKACVDAGVPLISLHDARHTSATTGADVGVPEHVMQRRLGHADSRTTREVYGFAAITSDRYPHTAATATTMARYITTEQFICGLNRVLDGLSPRSSAAHP